MAQGNVYNVIIIANNRPACKLGSRGGGPPDFGRTLTNLTKFAGFSPPRFCTVDYGMINYMTWNGEITM